MEEAAKIEVFGVNGKYFLISGEEGSHHAGDEGVLLRPNLKGAIDAPVKSLWLPGAYGQVFVDFRWERRDVVFTVTCFDPFEDTAEGWHTVDSDWRYAFDYVKQTEIRYTTSDGVRSLWVRLLEEPKAYETDPWEGRDPHIYHTGTVTMTVAAELPFYQGPPKVYDWDPPPEGTLAADVNFAVMANGPVPAAFTKTDFGAGGVSIINGALEWTESGALGAYEMFIYNADEADTDNHEVSVVFPGNGGEWGIFEGSVQLLIRSDGTINNYAFAEVNYSGPISSVRIGVVKDHEKTWLDFLGMGKALNINAGDKVSFGATGDKRFRLKINDETVYTVYDDDLDGPMGVGFRKVGFIMFAGPTFISGQVVPPRISRFEARDIPTTDERSTFLTVENSGDVPVWPRWVLSDKAEWTLPDYSFGNEEYGMGVADTERVLPMVFLPDGAGCVADSDPRVQTFIVANRMHYQGLMKGQDLLYPIPHGIWQIPVTVNNAEDGFKLRLYVPQWHTRPWNRSTSIPLHEVL
jgi:hypothetical protein